MPMYSNTVPTLLCGAFIAVLLGGCSCLPSSTSLDQLAADQALRQMEKDVSCSRSMTMVTAAAYPNFKELAATYSEQLETLNEDIERDVQKANTPEEALRAMAEDVSAYMLSVLPRDAEARGIDQHRLTVVMGDLINRDNDPVLEGGLALIRSNLINNRDFSNQFRLVAARQDRARNILDDLADPDYVENIGGDFEAGTSRKDIYVIEGRTWIQRGGYKDHKLTVYTEVFSWYPDDNEAFGSKLFIKNYFYHPYDVGFINEAENEKRRHSRD